MSELKSFVYLKGDEKKAAIDPAAQKAGVEMVLVLPSGKEIEVKAGEFKLVDKKAVEDRKAAMGPEEENADKGLMEAKKARKLAGKAPKAMKVQPKAK
jgi:hypothetical protein